MAKTASNGGVKPEFTQCAKALDNILDRFRTGNLTLEESLALFEEGVGHLKTCQATLSEARGKVEVLVDSLRKEGEAVSELIEEMEEYAFEDEEEDEE